MSRILALSVLIFFLLYPSRIANGLGYPYFAGQPELETKSLTTVISLYPDWITDGVQQSAEYGYSVGSAGDVNGDGYPDVIIGAPKYDTGVYREGTAFLFNGNAQGLNESPSWIVGGSISGARFGHSVASAGDVNCDGYDDVIVGAPRFNEGQSEEGAAFVFYGSPIGPSASANWMVQSDLKNTQYGASVAGAGDVNGDGCDDVIVGAPLFSGNLTSEGAAYLYYGSPAGLSTSPIWNKVGNQVSAMYGSAVSSAGDVNGDGYDDVLVSAPYFETGMLEEGRVFVYSGSASGLSSSPAWMVNGGQIYAHFGSAVASAGDLNGDGYDDIVIGTPDFDNDVGSNDEGAVFVYFGSPGGLSSINHWNIYSGQSASGFGISVTSAGDLDHDGYDEVMVGAHNYSSDQPYEGAAFIYKGSPSGLGSSHYWQVEGNKNDSYFGFSVACAGDVNQDGFADLVAGAPMHRKDDKTIMGRVFVYLGLDGEDIPPEPPVYPLFLPMIHLQD